MQIRCQGLKFPNHLFDGGFFKEVPLSFALVSRDKPTVCSLVAGFLDGVIVCLRFIFGISSLLA